MKLLPAQYAVIGAFLFRGQSIDSLVRERSDPTTMGAVSVLSATQLLDCQLWADEVVNLAAGYSPGEGLPDPMSPLDDDDREVLLELAARVLDERG